MSLAGNPLPPSAVPRSFRPLNLLLLLWGAAVLVPFVGLYPVPVRAGRLAVMIRDLAVAGGLLGGAAVLGRWLLARLRLLDLLPGPGARLLHGTALGCGTLGLAAFGAAMLRGLHPAPWLLAGGSVLLLGRRQTRELQEDLRRWAGEARSACGGITTAVAASVLAAAMFLMLLEALAPPTAYDALRYQLRLPRLYAEAGGWFDVPYDFSGAYPQVINLLYALAFALRAPGAAPLLHLGLGWLATGAVAMLAARAGGGAAGWVAAATFYTMPVVALNSAWSYVDMGLALFALLGVDAVLRHRAGAGWRSAGLAGTLGGLAFGVKYTGAAAPPVLAGLLLIRGPGSLRSRARHAVLLLGLATAVASPWVVRNAAFKGNPVYPFARSLFGSSIEDTYRAERHRADLEPEEVRSARPAEFLALPLKFTFAPWVRDEMVGPVPLLAAPWWILARGGGVGLLLGAALGFAAFWIILSPQVRLYLHGLGLLAAASGAGWTAVAQRGRTARRLAGGMLATGLAASLANLVVIQRTLSDPLPVVLGTESQEAYLQRNLEGYAAIRFLNEHLPPSSRVLFIGEIYGYYCRVPYLQGSNFDRAPVVDRIVRAPSLEAFLDGLEREGFTHVLYSMAQLRKHAGGPGRYFDWPEDGGRSRAIYREFMTAHLEIVFESDDAVVGRIRPRGLPPGGVS